MSLAAQLLALLVCPRCHGVLEYHEAAADVAVTEGGHNAPGDETTRHRGRRNDASDDRESLTCATCRLRYPVRDGIPIMLSDEASPL